MNWFGVLLRHPDKEADHRNQANRDERDKGRSPPEDVSYGCTCRYTEHVCKRKAAEHGGDGLCPLLPRNKVRRDDAPGSEEGSMAQCCQNAGGEHEREIGGQRATDV